MIYPHLHADFEQIIDDLGQDITIGVVTRTVDGDGRITNVSTSDIVLKALVEEIDDKQKDLLESGYYAIGDILFRIKPNTIVEIFDKVIWGEKIMSVKTIRYPQKIARKYQYKELHTIQDEIL